MEQQEFIEQFETIRSMYITCAGELNECHSKMLALIKQYQNGKTDYTFEYLRYPDIDINKASTDDLINIYADVKESHRVRQNSEIQSKIRDLQTGRNEYGPDNEYAKGHI